MTAGEAVRYHPAKISFLERVATEDERHVARLLELAAEACNTKNIGLLGSLFLKDAIIEIPAGRKTKRLDVRQYLRYTRAEFANVRRVTFGEILIRVTGMTSAVVSANSYIWFSRRYHPVVSPRRIEAAKKGGKWLIISVVYP